jgi:hypothetical protein
MGLKILEDGKKPIDALMTGNEVFNSAAYWIEHSIE